jgi:hypothetical protein
MDLKKLSYFIEMPLDNNKSYSELLGGILRKCCLIKTYSAAEEIISKSISVPERQSGLIELQSTKNDQKSSKTTAKKSETYQKFDTP